jgi:hypothetical protein
MWNLISVHLEIALILTQDRCTVCPEHTIGSKIILDAPDGTPRLRGSCGTSFQTVWRLLVFVQYRCMVCTEHTTGSKNILDAHVGLLGALGHVVSRFDPFSDSANLDAR